MREIRKAIKEIVSKSGRFGQTQRIGHRLIGPSGEVKSDGPITRWPDHPILAIYNVTLNESSQSSSPDHLASARTRHHGAASAGICRAISSRVPVLLAAGFGGGIVRAVSVERVSQCYPRIAGVAGCGAPVAERFP